MGPLSSISREYSQRILNVFHVLFLSVRSGGYYVFNCDELPCRRGPHSLRRCRTIGGQDIYKRLATLDVLFNADPIFLIPMHDDVKRREIRLNSLEEPARVLQPTTNDRGVRAIVNDFQAQPCQMDG